MELQKKNHRWVYLALTGIVILRIFDVMTPNIKYGRVFYRYGLYEEEKNKSITRAQEFYEKAVRYNPNIAEAYYRLGRIYREKGDLNTSLIFFQKASSLTRDLTGVFEDLGSVYEQMGQYNRAITTFEEAIHASPSDSAIHYKLGEVYLLNNQKTYALQVVRDLEHIKAREVARKLELRILETENLENFSSNR